MANPLAEDLDYILKQTKAFWEELRGKRIFVTGGTGFFGCWLLESFSWVNKKLDLKAELLVLTRDYEAFKKKRPHLCQDPAISFQQGDIRTFRFPEGRFSHVIHAAATSAEETYNNEDPKIKAETVVEGTKRALEFAVQCQAQKFLYTSSGVVYGEQPADLPNISEDYQGKPEPRDRNFVWGKSKLLAEELCLQAFKKHGLEAKIARCFSFVGPYLPLDIHYAIGNFIRDGLKGGPIKIKGDGTPYRSYLYVADLIIWLWTILFKGQAGRIYNVGSGDGITIADLAKTVAKVFDQSIEVEIAGKHVAGQKISRYVPAVDRVATELGLKQTISLPEAIKKTINYYSVRSMV